MQSYGTAAPELFDLERGVDIPWPKDAPVARVRERSFAFTADGRAFFSGGEGQLHLWQLDTGREIRRFVGHDKAAHCWVLAANEQRMLSEGTDNTVRVWDVKTGRLLHTLGPHVDTTLAAALSADGRWVALAIRIERNEKKDYSFQLWDLKTGKEDRRFAGHEGLVKALTFSPDSRQIVSGDDVGIMRVWDRARGKVTRRFKAPIDNPDYPDPKSWTRAAVEAVAFLPDGKSLLAGGEGRLALRCLDVASGKEVIAFEDSPWGVKAIAVSQDGRRALTVSRGEHLILWDLTTGAEIRTLTGPNSDKPGMRFVGFSPDSKRALSPGTEYTQPGPDPTKPDARGQEKKVSDHVIKVWDVRTGKVLRLLRGNRYPVHAAVFLPDNKHVVSWSPDRSLRLWDADTGVIIRTIEEVSEEWVWVPLAVSPDGRLAVTGGSNCRVWELATGKEVRRLTVDAYGDSSIAFAPDNRRVLIGSKDERGSLYLMDLTSGECVRRFAQAGSGSKMVAVSADGTLALSVWGRVVLWDVGTGKELRTLLRPPEDQVSLFYPRFAFAPNGKHAVISYSGLVHIWDLRTGALVRELVGKGGPEGLLALAYSPDGRFVLAGGGSGRLKLWDVASGKELRTPADNDTP